MATSGSTNFTLTRNQIVSAALRKVGAYDQGSSPTQEAINEGAEALNVMVKGWQTREVFLWATEWATKTFTSADLSFSPAADTLGIEKAFYRDSSGSDTHVDIIDFDEYNNINDKNATGKILAIAYEPKLSPVIHVYQPVADLTDVLHYQRVRKLEDFDAAGDNPDFPEEWLEALIYGLAYRLSTEYGVEINSRMDLKTASAESFIVASNGVGPTTRGRTIWPSYNSVNISNRRRYGR